MFGSSQENVGKASRGIFNLKGQMNPHESLPISAKIVSEDLPVKRNLPTGN
jgi:hypothetical protein